MSAPTFNIGGVPCSGYYEDELVESYGEEGPTATMTIQCAWESRRDVINALLGTVTLNGSTLMRNLPYMYPPDSDLDSPRFCLDIPEVRGVKERADVAIGGGSTGWITYKYARIKAVFGVVLWSYSSGDPDLQNDPSGLAYTVTKIKTSSEVFSPPGGAFYYKGGPNNGKPVEESTVGIPRPRVEIVMTRMMLPLIPLVGIMNLAGGTVNLDPITIGDFDFPKGFLLFLCSSTEPRIEKATGMLLQDVEMSFLGNGDFEWNKFMDRSGAFNLINDQSGGGGNPPFEYADFSPLFSDDLS